MHRLQGIGDASSAPSSRRRIVMLGSAPDTRGGVGAVVRAYRRAGLFDRWPITHLPTHRHGPPWEKAVLAAVALARFHWLLAMRRIGLVHVHGASDASFWRKLLFMVPAFVAGCPVLFHLHGGGFVDFYRRRGRVGRSLVRLVLRRSQRVVVLSAQWEEEIRAIASAARPVIIANPVEVPDPPRDHLNPATLDVAFLGRLERDKGIYDLLEAFVEVQRRFPAARLRCAGDGDLAGVRRRAEALGIEKAVECLGWIGDREKWALLSTSAVCALPSYYEGLPMAVLEAMAAAVPVVATRVGGIPAAITDGVEGVLIAPGDCHALSASLCRLLEDADLRVRMGQAARARTEREFAAPAVLAKVEAIYREVGIFSDRDLGPGRSSTS